MNGPWRPFFERLGIGTTFLERSLPSRSYRAIVPAAGLGTRMRPLTYACPKELLPVGSRPVIHRLLDELADAGIGEACIVTSAGKPLLEEYLARVTFPFAVRFARQEAPRGLGDAILCAEEFAAGEPVVIALGDSLIESRERIAPLSRMLRLHDEMEAGIILGEVVPDDRISRYGVMDPADPVDAAREEAFPLRGIVEKPPVERAPSRVAASARYVLPGRIFEALNGLKGAVPAGGELGLAEGLSALLREGEPLYGMKLRAGERRWDIGGFETYFAAFTAYAARDRAAAP